MEMVINKIKRNFLYLQSLKRNVKRFFYIMPFKKQIRLKGMEKIVSAVKKIKFVALLLTLI